MKNRQKTWMGVGLFALAGTSLSTATATPSRWAPDQPSISRPDGPANAGGAGAGRASPRAAKAARAAKEAKAERAAKAAKVAAQPSNPIRSSRPIRTRSSTTPSRRSPPMRTASMPATRRRCRVAKKLEEAVEALLANPTDETLAAAREGLGRGPPGLSGDRDVPLLRRTDRGARGPDQRLADERGLHRLCRRQARRRHHQRRHRGLASPSSSPRTRSATRPTSPPAGTRSSSCSGARTSPPTVRATARSATIVAGQGQQRPPPRLSAARSPSSWSRTSRRVAGRLAPGADNYARKFLALPQREAIGRIMNGMAVLAGFEFMSERLAVALDSGDQEDEHSCFSDTTHQDFVYDLKGIENVWTGTYPGAAGPGIEALVAKVDPALADRGRRAACRRHRQGRRARRPLGQGSRRSGRQPGTRRRPKPRSTRSAEARRRPQAGRQQARRAGADSNRLSEGVRGSP